MIHPVILSGGSGTRLWPLSRELYPKQLLPLNSEDRSLLQETVCRLNGMGDTAPVAIVCNEQHRFLVAEHLRQLGLSPYSIILEPEGRNTAPALTLAALALSDSRHGSGSDDPVMLVMPSDHVIHDVSRFQKVIEHGAGLAQNRCLVTFGIVPTAPKTGYGYIKKGQPLVDSANGVMPFRIDRFVEKPDEGSAAKMLESEEYLWNSGIFMMRASVWLDQIEQHRSDIAQVCRAAYEKGSSDGYFYRPDANMFRSCPSDSIDYAVMERVVRDISDNGSHTPQNGHVDCAVLPLDAGWSDIGSWASLWEERSRDPNGNVIQGDVYAQGMRNSLVMGQHRLVATVGLEDVIVVETADAVLVMHKKHAQDVKSLVERLKSEKRSEHETHRRVHRPWGSYETIDLGPRFQVKRLTVNPGAALSLQMHHHRAEHWVVVRGTATVTIGDDVSMLTENQSTYVPVGAIHRLENSGSIPLEIIEVQTGSYLGEDDIVRLEDRYNRHK